MARRKAIKSTLEESRGTPIMDSLSLEPGTHVRFRTRPDQHWTTGIVRGDNKDGSLTIYDRDSRSRSIMPANVQKKTRGPRGGALWVDL